MSVNVNPSPVDATLWPDGRTLRLTLEAARPLPTAGFGFPDGQPGADAGLALTASNGAVFKFKGALARDFDMPCGQPSAGMPAGTLTAGNYYVALAEYNGTSEIAWSQVAYITNLASQKLWLISKNPSSGNSVRIYISDTNGAQSTMKLAVTTATDFSVTNGILAVDGPDYAARTSAWSPQTPLRWTIDLRTDTPIVLDSGSFTITAPAGWIQDSFGNASAAISSFGVTNNSLVGSDGFCAFTQAYLEASVDYSTRLLYVSETFGNDSTGTGSKVSPYQTFAKCWTRAAALSYGGHPFAILALSTDTFTTAVQGVNISQNKAMSGQSATRPVVMAPYYQNYGQGAEPVPAPRPKFRVTPSATSGTTALAFGQFGVNTTFNCITGLDCANTAIDAFDNNNNAGKTTIGLVIAASSVSHLTAFDCGFQRFAPGLDIEQARKAPGGYLDSNALVRCVVVDSFGQGMYLSDTRDFLVADCVFDQNGVNADFAGGGAAGGLNHNCYFQYDGDPVHMYSCLIRRGANVGVQFRPGGLCGDTIFSANAAATFVDRGGGSYKNVVVEKPANRFDAPAGRPGALASGGTLTFTQGSTAVTGSGTAFLTDLAPHVGTYPTTSGVGVCLLGNTSLWRVASVTDDTHLTLLNPYTLANSTGTGASGSITYTPQGFGLQFNTGSANLGTPLYQVWPGRSYAIDGGLFCNYAANSPAAPYFMNIVMDTPIAFNEGVIRNVTMAGVGSAFRLQDQWPTAPLPKLSISKVIYANNTNTSFYYVSAFSGVGGYPSGSVPAFWGSDNNDIVLPGGGSTSVFLNLSAESYTAWVGAGQSNSEAHSISTAPVWSSTGTTTLPTYDLGSWYAANGGASDEASAITALRARPRGTWGTFYDIAQAVAGYMAAYTPVNLPNVGSGGLNYYGAAPYGVSSVAYAIGLSATTGTVGVPVTATITLTGGTFGVASHYPITVTGGAATESPASITLAPGATSGTATVTPTAGPETLAIGASNDQGMTTPAARTYAVTAATGYALAAPSPASGTLGVPSNNFVLTATPAGQAFGALTHITPAVAGGTGTFFPSPVVAPAGSTTASFAITPTSAGLLTVSTTNDQGLTDPASVNYSVDAAPLGSYRPRGGWAGRVAS